MSLKEAQKDVDRWTGQFKPQYWPPLEQFARLVEEVGELGRELNHRFGSKKKKSTEKDKELGDEMADIVFTLACIANGQDIDLDKAWQKNIAKHYGRDNQRFQRK
jgi:NTP pyrophosphatase (non-canonical NTP hydrolase)